MATYSTPGVYVKEISTFPPSVAEVSTAIPAFIGYTEKGPAATEEPKVSRINNLLDYESIFGSAQNSSYAVNADFNQADQLWHLEQLTRTVSNNKDFLMYYALSLYFKNGGGSCYIISIGNYSDTHDKDHFNKGLMALEKEDEPTLIVATDALGLADADYFALGEAMLAQCNTLGDRFSIFDIPSGDNQTDAFRTGIGMSFLKYGAAYHPFLQTTLSYQYQESGVTVTINNDSPNQATPDTWQKSFGENGITIHFAGASDNAPQARISAGVDADPVDFTITQTNVLQISNTSTKSATDIETAWTGWLNDPANNANGYSIITNGDASGPATPSGNVNVPLDPVADDADNEQSMADLKNSHTALYNQLKILFNEQRVVLPPAAAIAGVYARVDRNRGVWKAPANESISAIIGPVEKITDEAQGRLNIDTEAGKSINVIRAFTGKGTLVWGARTLAGNDNEWRYVSVRRLFIMIEESTQKSTAFAVFEPNDATTWLKVKAMIESFLLNLWERGALAGPTPESAYFVNVGLGKTMTTDDILNGRLIVEIGIAAVRPAEFIILKFSHKLQEA